MLRVNLVVLISGASAANDTLVFVSTIEFNECKCGESDICWKIAVLNVRYERLIVVRFDVNADIPIILSISLLTFCFYKFNVVIDSKQLLFSTEYIPLILGISLPNR